MLALDMKPSNKPSSFDLVTKLDRREFANFRGFLEKNPGIKEKLAELFVPGKPDELSFEAFVRHCWKLHDLSDVQVVFLVMDIVAESATSNLGEGDKTELEKDFIETHEDLDEVANIRSYVYGASKPFGRYSSQLYFVLMVVSGKYMWWDVKTPIPCLEHRVKNDYPKMFKTIEETPFDSKRLRSTGGPKKNLFEVWDDETGEFDGLLNFKRMPGDLKRKRQPVEGEEELLSLKRRKVEFDEDIEKKRAELEDMKSELNPMAGVGFKSSELQQLFQNFMEQAKSRQKMEMDDIEKKRLESAPLDDEINKLFQSMESSNKRCSKCGNFSSELCPTYCSAGHRVNPNFLFCHDCAFDVLGASENCPCCKSPFLYPEMTREAIFF